MGTASLRTMIGKPQSSSSKFNWKKGWVAHCSRVKMSLWLTASSGTEGNGRIQAKSEASPL